MTRLLTAVLIAILVMVPAGCSRNSDDGDAASEQEVASSLGCTPADGVDVDDGLAGGDGVDVDDTTDPLYPSGEYPSIIGESGSLDPSVLSLELDAIREELDAISLPDDTDFAEIEEALK